MFTSCDKTVLLLQRHQRQYMNAYFNFHADGRV